MAKKTKKSNPIHFGIEVTKPHSKEMYNHNDKVAEELKLNISNAWKKLVKDFPGLVMDMDWSGIKKDSDLNKLQKNVMYYGYGDGYTIKDVQDEFYNDLENMANWQLHEVYSYCCFESLVPRVKQCIIGHNDFEKMDYWTDEKESALDIVKRIAGGDLRFSSHTDVNGKTTKHPYIKVYRRDEGEEVVNKLLAYDIDAYVDCYEADDGDDDYGRPIMINFYSVKIKNL